MEPLCFLNGQLLPLKDAKIGIFDLGVLRGFGIYEGITSFDGKPFHYDAHWDRFERSAKPLGLRIPFSKDEVREAMRTLIARNAPGQRATLRMALTGGLAEGGIEHVPGRETLFITAEPAVPLPPELYGNGGTLITYEHERFMPEAKTIHYITAVTLQGKRKAAGAIEILYTSKGDMLECATSNAMIVKDGAVITPKDRVLPGITRLVTLELAREAGIPVEERPVSMDEVFAADEFFMTSSFKDIVPIVSIDGKAIGNGAPGPLTRRLMELFATHAHPLNSRPLSSRVATTRP